MRYATRPGIVREIADWLFDPATTDLGAVAACLASVPDWASWTIAHHPWRQRAGREAARAIPGSAEATLLAAKTALLDAEHTRRLQRRHRASAGPAAGDGPAT